MKSYWRFYGALNSFLPNECRQCLFEHEFLTKDSIKDMIESLGVPHTEVDAILVNGISQTFNYIVQDQDKISIYPVFFQLDIPDFIHLHPGNPDPLRFVLDVHLGKLCRHLRMLGFDVWYENNADDPTLAKISSEENRVLLTRDTNLLKRNQVAYGYYVRATDPDQQIQEVCERFPLRQCMQPFTRCMICNALFKSVDKASILSLVPEQIGQTYNEFYQCTGCGRVYWKGSHYEKMRKLL